MNKGFPELEPTESASSASKGFHPKLFLKNLQQKFYTSPRLYLIFCFIVPFAIMYGIYLSRGIYPFGNGTPLVLDLNWQYSYFFEGLRNLIYGDADSFLYSFSRSLGGEFMGMYAYYLASPLSYIVALFPQSRIQDAILTIILVKAGLCGASFGYYLHRHTKNPQKICTVIFSAMYALNAYAVCQQSNTMWIDALIWLPLLTLAIEELILNGKYKLYVISLSVILISNYYIGYMLCIFAVLYFFCFYFSKKPEEINPKGEKLHFVRSGVRFALFSILSAAIAAFMLFAAYYSLSFGKTDFSNPDWTLKGNFDVIDFLVKFLPGSYDTFEPSGIPFVYCGLLSLILLPVYFISKKISPREKISFGALLGFLIISMFLNPLDLIWHGFSVPNWLNGRYSFLLCFVMIVLAYKGFGNLKAAGEKFLLGVCGFIILFVAVAEKFELKSFINSNKKLLTFGCIWFSIAFTVALLVLLCLRIRLTSKKSQRCVSAVLASVVCIELLCNGIVCFIKMNDDVGFTTYSRYQNFNEGLRPVVKDLKEYDQSFYRFEKRIHNKYNDNFALGIKGISNSTSTLNKKAIDFINYMGYTGRSHLTQYNGGTPVSDSLLGIKYVISKKGDLALDGIYDAVEEIEDEDYKVYKNPYALPLAYGVSKDLQEYDMSADTFFDRYNSMVGTMLGDGEDANIFLPVSNATFNRGNCQKGIGTSTYQSPKSYEGYFSIIYTAPYTGNYYFYPSDYSAFNVETGYSPESIDVSINTGDRKSYLEKDSNHVLDVGFFEEGSEIRITFYFSQNCKFELNTDSPLLWYMDSAAYEESFERLLANPRFEISDGSTDDHLSGTVSTENEGQMILTTIPYDKGWNIYVDGNKVETYEALDALMAFDIEQPGEHTLEMKYFPAVYKIGIFVSAVGIVAFIYLCAIEFVLKKTIFKDKAETVVNNTWTLEDFDDIYEEEEQVFDGNTLSADGSEDDEP